jgi:hypothetical protein
VVVARGIGRDEVGCEQVNESGISLTLRRAWCCTMLVLMMYPCACVGQRRILQRVEAAG